MARFQGIVTGWFACVPRHGAESGTTSRYEPRDRYYERAKAAGYRSRGAFKLQDLLRRVPKLEFGDAVVDLGCWPGGWLQILAEHVGPNGALVGVDIEPVDPLAPPVTLLELDFTSADAAARIARALGRPADLVVCDAAPKLSGIRDVDRAAEEELYAAALRVAERLLKPAGSLIVKGFPGPEADHFRQTLRERFERVAEVRPEAKRKTSKEFYWVATTSPSGRRSGKRS